MNAFKEAIAKNTRQWGLWMSLASPVAADALSRLGYDWLVCDTEHAPLDVAGALPILQASDMRTNIVVRPAANDRVLIKRHLDQGAKTLLIPYVETREQAEEAILSCHYPPKGLRGVAGGVRASGFGTNKNYLHEASDEICLIVQIETKKGLENLEAIASLEGIDGIFIGPHDLSASMGYLGNPWCDEMQNTIHDAVKRITACGKPAGILALSVEEGRRYAEMGFCFIAAGTDLGLLMAEAKARVEAMRGGD